MEGLSTMDLGIHGDILKPSLCVLRHSRVAMRYVYTDTFFILYLGYLKVQNKQESG